MNEQPIFEVFYKDGTHYKIYEDGKIEGFPDDPMIVNRYLARIAPIQGKNILLSRSLEKIQQIFLEADRMGLIYTDSIMSDKG